MFDVVIVGGGVVGCSVLDELTLAGYNCCLLEKESHLVSGASSGNSGQIDLYHEHSSTLEYLCLSLTKQHIHKFFRHSGLPYKAVGGLMLAWSPKQLSQLHDELIGFHRHGFSSCRIVQKAELYQLEPNLRRGAQGALLLPHITMVDPWLTPVARAHRAKKNNATIVYDCEVLGGSRHKKGHWVLDTREGDIECKFVINAAGLNGDKVEAIAERKPNFNISPRKGQYIVYGKQAGRLINHALFQLPTEKGRGVIIFPTVYGNLVVGPTATNTTERRHPAIEADVRSNLVNYAHKIVPALSTHEVLTSYAGLRPATEDTDYIIRLKNDINWLTLAGIRSTGVSSSVGLSKYVKDLLTRHLQPSHKNRKIQKPDITSEYHVLPGSGDILIEDTPYHVTHMIARCGIDEESIVKAKL